MMIAIAGLFLLLNNSGHSKISDEEKAKYKDSRYIKEKDICYIQKLNK